MSHKRKSKSNQRKSTRTKRKNTMYKTETITPKESLDTFNIKFESSEEKSTNDKIKDNFKILSNKTNDFVSVSNRSNIYKFLKIFIVFIPPFSFIFLFFLLFDVAYIFDNISIIIKSSVIIFVILILSYILYLIYSKLFFKNQTIKYFLSYAYNVVVISTIFILLKICCENINIIDNLVYYKICKCGCFIFFLFSILWIINPSLDLIDFIKPFNKLVSCFLEFLDSNDILLIKQSILQIISCIFTFFGIFVSHFIELFNLSTNSINILRMYSMILLLYIISYSLLQVIIIQKDIKGKIEIISFLFIFFILLCLFSYIFTLIF